MASQHLAIRRQEIIRNLANVRQRIEAIVEGKYEARLVAISKLKPISDIRIAYEDGQRHFGENYVDSQNKADLMNKVSASRESPLRVFVQVNTKECITVLNHVQDNCPKLQLVGLMTIGAPNRDPKEPNPDFILLKSLRAQFQEARGIELELSMGMSDDFEEALKLGATN
ncbi:16636_t:CDS:2, partial [Racocetra fulgida]